MVMRTRAKLLPQILPPEYTLVPASSIREFVLHTYAVTSILLTLC